jgi:hypothetical protein
MHPEETLRPTMGQWYYDRTNDREFEVIRIDKEEGILEIQYLEGELEEVDLDTWEDMNLAKIAEPDDWEKEDEVAKDDYEDLDNLESDEEDWDPLEEDEDDDWQD